MDHGVRAFLGYSDRINSLANSWLRNPLQLSQGLSILFLTNSLFDDITELENVENEMTFDGFNYLTSAVICVLEEYSYLGKLAYFEIEYSNGKGLQAAIIYENGKQKFPAVYTTDMNIWSPDEKRAMNIILREFGVYKLNGKDEFNSVEIGYFREME